MYKKPLFYLVFATLLLVGGLLLQKYAGTYYNSQAYFSQLVEKNLQEEIREMEYEMVPLLDSIPTAEILNFGDFNRKTKYPYFVFGNQELKVWSEYHFAPDYHLIEGNYSIKLISYNNDIFIARKWFSESKTGQIEIVSLLPIYTDFAVQNKYLANFTNEDLFNRQEVSISIEADKDAYAIEFRDTPVFWLKDLPNFSPTNSPYKTSLFIIYNLAILFLIVALVLWTLQIAVGKRKWIMLLATLAIWVVLKVTMNVFEFPGALLGIDLFDSRFFAVSWFERSFADLLLNTIIIFLLSAIAFKNYRVVIEKTHSNSMVRLFYAILLVFLLNLVFNYQYLQLRTIYFNSQISLDITKSLTFDSFRVLALFVFFLISLSTAMLFHILFKRLEIQASSKREKVISLIAGSVIFGYLLM
jgi:two-component system nitrogen regulation sensor histidine kinase NtrY